MYAYLWVRVYVCAFIFIYKVCFVETRRPNLNQQTLNKNAPFVWPQKRTQKGQCEINHCRGYWNILSYIKVLRDGRQAHSDIVNFPNCAYQQQLFNSLTISHITNKYIKQKFRNIQRHFFTYLFYFYQYYLLYFDNSSARKIGIMFL